ncbi:MAG: glycosyltransferase family 2 protein, partial [Candidatus Omnitrophica bacterium]|nr:glycosyltransferase family 2 protein [Candidatus Omnitrophota bacterium]
MKPFLSICIPTYNRANKLSRLLNTLRADIFSSGMDGYVQTMVSDNSSSDNTFKVMSKILAADKKIKYFRQPENIGFDANVRFLYEQADSEYVWFFSDDDMPLPAAIPIILKGLKTYNPDILLFSFIQPPGSKRRTFDFPEAYVTVEEPQRMIESVMAWTKLSIYVLRKVLLNEQQKKELEPFLSNAFFFLSLSFSVLSAS